MKFCILISLLLSSSVSLFALEELKEKLVVSEEVKVKIVEEVPRVPTENLQKTSFPEVEIEIVEKIDSTLLGVHTENVSSVPTSSISQPIAVAELTPTNPDKNLVIYFILLMVVVVGIMILASVIPASRSRNSQQ